MITFKLSFYSPSILVYRKLVLLLQQTINYRSQLTTAYFLY